MSHLFILLIWLIIGDAHNGVQVGMRDQNIKMYYVNKFRPLICTPTWLIAEMHTEKSLF